VNLEKVQIELCQFYDVTVLPGAPVGFKYLCDKGHRAGIKCQSERLARACPDYKPSQLGELEELAS